MGFRAQLRLDPLEARLVLTPSPVLLDPNLAVRTVVTGLTSPTTMAFLGANDFFVLEKATGKVDHAINGVVEATKFDFGGGPIANLPVNNNSERGLLGVALSPNFVNDHDVFMYWTQSSTGTVDPNAQNTPLLGNRVDRFIWNAATSTFTFDRNIIQLHSFQNDGNNVLGFQGNHNGGIIRFGPDGKLYIVIGDNGRRGWMQNLINGPQGPGQTDENFGSVRGGPAPDDAHLTGVLLRLNPDGTIPGDNPFVGITDALQAPVLGGSAGGIGSFTSFYDQAAGTLTSHIFFQGLSAPAAVGQIRLDDPNGPVIFSDPGFHTGQTDDEFTNTITAANFVAEPLQGIYTMADAINAVLAGRAYFTVYTSEASEITGQINALDPEITTNLHRVFAYGIRNTFGFAFDPLTGKLWLEENGDVSFDRYTIVAPGSNNGWIQADAPALNADGTLDDTAIQEDKMIEVALNGLQQIRWPARNLPDTAQEALDRMVVLPGSHYNPSIFSVRAEDPPAGVGFLHSGALGAQYQDAFFAGEARDFGTDAREEFNGGLFVFHPNADRTGIDFGNDPNIRPSDHVFMNNSDFDLNGDTSFLLGTNFGILTDFQTGPDGNLYVVSLTGGTTNPTDGSVFEIYRKDAVTPFRQQNLVSDLDEPPGGPPAVTDALLKNPWGISFSGASPFWIANAGSGTSTLYAGHDAGDFMKNSLEVAVPPAPTGTVFNGTTDFVLSNGMPGRFLFDGLDGSIFGWNGGGSAEREITVPNAVYTGLALGSSDLGNVLYAANVSQGTVDVFDTTFAHINPSPQFFAFSDPNLPAGLTSYKPFNIQNLGGTLYVTYRNSADPEHGGIVDAFDQNGNFLRRVVSGGVNAPWGLALAPAGFGDFGGALLVGNFGLGDGKINAFDPNTGQFLGYVTDADGVPLAIEGLWALAFGNGGMGGDPNTLYFTAGLNRMGGGSFAAADGLLGAFQFAPSNGAVRKGGTLGVSGTGAVTELPLAVAPLVDANLVSAVAGPAAVSRATLSVGLVVTGHDTGRLPPAQDLQTVSAVRDDGGVPSYHTATPADDVALSLPAFQDRLGDDTL
jgi:uncharacterized protein (TIGR03118 family)